MKKAKPTDITNEQLETICEIINKGYQAEVKKEHDCIVIVENRRKAYIKSPIK